MDHKGEVCKTVGFSKRHSETRDVVPLPNPAMYENQGATPLARRQRRHSAFGGPRGARRASTRGKTPDQPAHPARISAIASLLAACRIGHAWTDTGSLIRFR